MLQYNKVSNIETLPPPTSAVVLARRAAIIDLRKNTDRQPIFRPNQAVKTHKEAMLAHRALRRNVLHDAYRPTAPMLGLTSATQTENNHTRRQEEVKKPEHTRRNHNTLRRKIAAVGVGILALFATFGSTNKLSSEQIKGSSQVAVTSVTEHPQTASNVELSVASPAQAVDMMVRLNPNASTPWDAYVEAYGSPESAAEHLQQDINANPHIKRVNAGTNQEQLSIDGNSTTPAVIVALEHPQA